MAEELTTSAVPKEPMGSQKDEQKTADASKRQRKPLPMPNRATCLAQLGQLTGLIAARAVTPAQGNAIRATLDSTLNHLRHEETLRAKAGIPNPDLLELLRTESAAAQHSGTAAHGRSGGNALE